MPGLYLLAIILSAAGVATLDWRHRLALWAAPTRTVAATAIGTVFFLVWDAVGIATGVFVKGDSDSFIGITLAPQLPLEEPFFLVFLSYLAAVLWSAARRVGLRRSVDDSTGPH